MYQLLIAICILLMGNVARADDTKLPKKAEPNAVKKDGLPTFERLSYAFKNGAELSLVEAKDGLILHYQAKRFGKVIERFKGRTCGFPQQGISDEDVETETYQGKYKKVFHFKFKFSKQGTFSLVYLSNEVIFVRQDGWVRRIKLPRGLSPQAREKEYIKEFLSEGKRLFSVIWRKARGESDTRLLLI